MFVVPLVISLHLWFGNAYCWINQPIGPELCKRQCCNYFWSALCGYQVPLMKCLPTIGNGESNWPSDVKRLNHTQICDFQISNQYGKCSKIVSTRAEGISCIKQSIAYSSMVSSGRNVRLVMTDLHRNDFTYYFQLNMFNHSVTPYYYIESKVVTALAYVKSCKTIIVVSHIPSVIESYGLEKYENEIILHKNDRLTVIALIAEDMTTPYKVYFTTDKNEVYRMTILGEKQRIKGLRVKTSILGITIDPYKNILYACHPSHVLVVSLSRTPRGRITKTVLKSNTSTYTAVSFNKADRSLYYNDGHELRKRSDGRSSKVISLDTPIRQISCNGEKVFVTYWRSDYRKLSEIDIRTGIDKVVDLSSHFSRKFILAVVD